MSKPTLTRQIADKLPFYYGWISLTVAILAMIATLPGRSVGIGLITEPFIADFGITRTAFTEMIFWATVIGAVFALLVGPAIDRFGGRWVLAAVTFLLAGSVVYTSATASALLLLPLWILTRGLGQSALSATSLTVVGKWFEKRLSLAMGVLALLISIGFTIVILTAAATVDTSGWRSVWSAIGYGILGVSLLSILFLRRDPETLGLPVDGITAGTAAEESPVFNSTSTSTTFWNAMQHPAFWGFAVGSAAYNFVISGVTLLNESIMTELGFGDSFEYAMGAYAFFGLIGNVMADRLTRKFGLRRLMAVAMLLVGIALAVYPLLDSLPLIIAHGALFGLAGGVVMVVFFSSFGTYFGRLHLGKIQGAAQVLAVLASASGPWIMSATYDAYGSYTPIFYALTPFLLACALYAWWMPET